MEEMEENGMDRDRDVRRDIDRKEAPAAPETPVAAGKDGVALPVMGDDQGMSTIEYALGCVAAAALGALLYLVVTSDAVEGALTAIFQRALDTQ
ncbi:MAG: DUF4244 domain-containing protein [Corynebacterium sp.]|jgi:hypothetical protein|uniref:DUF4244 domain-containing protein n=1 Tax=unclassified Corynebacterium TaxID=2624378 RepID=UPI000AEE8A18